MTQFEIAACLTGQAFLANGVYDRLTPAVVKETAIVAKGPRGAKRPDDPARAAVRALRIAAGEAHEELDACAIKKDPAAVALGRRARTLSAEERVAIARRAARARWSRDAE